MKSYSPLKREEYLSIKQGDTIERMLAFVLPMPMLVTKVDDDYITASPLDALDIDYTFDRESGLEVDPELKTVPSYISAINPPLTDYTKEKIKARLKKADAKMRNMLINLLAEKLLRIHKK